MNDPRLDERFRALKRRYLEELGDEFARFKPLLAPGRGGVLAGRERNALLRSAHNWKGSGGTYGFPAITQLASDLETRLQHGDDDRAVASTLRDLLSMYRTLCHDFGER